LVSGQALIGTIIGLMDTTNDESVLSRKEVGVLLRFDLFALQEEIKDEFTFILSFLEEMLL
jgi:hypothetical protein